MTAFFLQISRSFPEYEMLEISSTKYIYFVPPFFFTATLLAGAKSFSGPVLSLVEGSIAAESTFSRREGSVRSSADSKLTFSILGNSTVIPLFSS